MILNIDKEFKELIPAPDKEEYRELEESLLNEGFKSDCGKIITWNNIIVDGHNRYELCLKHNIEFEFSEREFEDRAEVKLWIIKNQLRRRNVNEFVKSELALKQKDIIAAKAKERMLSGKRNNPVQISSQGELEGKTRDQVAQIAGVSHDTIRKVEKILESAPKHIKDKARSGEMKVNTAFKEMQRELNETKRCIVCGKEKPLAEFYVSQNEGDRGIFWYVIKINTFLSRTSLSPSKLNITKATVSK